MTTKKTLALAIALPLILSVVGAVSVVRAANSSGSCKGLYKLKNFGTALNPDWKKTGHACIATSTCPTETNYTGTCQESLKQMFPDGNALYTCACKYVWNNTEENPPIGQSVIYDIGNGCDSWVKRAPDTSAFVDAWCAGECPSGKLCKTEMDEEEELPAGTVKDVKCICKDNT